MKIKLLFTLFILAILQCFAGEVAYDLGKDYVFIDVRSLEEACEDHLDTKNPSILLPYDANFENKVDSLSIYKDMDIILFCRTGGRAGFAKAILEDAGFKKVENIKTLQNAKDFVANGAKLMNVSRQGDSARQGNVFEMHIPTYTKRLGIKEDVLLLLKENNFDKLNEIFNEDFISNPDRNMSSLMRMLYVYISRSYISSYYLSDLHPFYADINPDNLPERLRSAYAKFKIEQKKSMQMKALVDKLRFPFVEKVQMGGFLEPL